jgi:hypothetical protein
MVIISCEPCSTIEPGRLITLGTFRRALPPKTGYFYSRINNRVTVETILPAELGVTLPVCLAGANACPPEDVGGPPGYTEFLEAIRDPAHPEHAEMLDWCGGEFDPTAFRLDAINAALHQFKP